MKSTFLQTVITKAKTSRRYLFLLNLGISRLIPFNKPHKFRIVSISENDIKVSLPNIRRNQNHIRGIHACALATLSELASGLLLISRLDSTRYRIIMKKLEIDYFYQAKEDVHTHFHLDEELLEEIRNTVSHEPYDFRALVNIFDKNENKICTAAVIWQIKSWDLVKTKV